MAAGTILPAAAQTQTARKYTTDKDLSRWVIDLNVFGGGYTQKMDVANTAPNYLNGINLTTGTTGFKNGKAIGGDVQLGFFFGKNRHWGLGTGLLYMRASGDVTLDKFRAEYQSVDNNGFIFRQVVSTNGVTEQIKADNFSIPLVLKYKNRMSKHWGFAAEAGALFNLSMKNNYTTNASFDYEAIYKFTKNGDGTATPIYETAPVPADNDFLITRSHYVKNNPNGNVQDYFNTKQSQGYNVGLGVMPNSKTGTAAYKSGSVGFMFQPSVNYFFSDHVALNVGAYYIYQPFSGKGSDNNYMMTNKTGEYNSVMNSAATVQTQSYGANVGLRFFLGNKAPAKIVAADQSNPTKCGLCDAAITLHGAHSGAPTTVVYNINGAKDATSYSGVAATDGSIKVPGLCSGVYTGVKLSTDKKKVKGQDITIVDPPLRVTLKSTNATAKGTCDGSLTISGLNAGQNATVTYMLNGTPQATYTAIVAQDNSVTVSGLCEGTYTSIQVASSQCAATVSTPAGGLSVTAPAPPPPPAEPQPQAEAVDMLTPILFNFNSAVIHSGSYPFIDEAVKELKDDKNTVIIVDGHTDAIGTHEYNQKLSEGRAGAVKTYLKKKGIDPKRIKTNAHGETAPAAPNDSDEGRSKNRRAEMHLQK